MSARPELLVVVGLLAAVVLFGRGVPLGIAALGVVAGCVVGLHSMGIALLYSRTRVLSFAQFGLGAGAAVFFFLWILYNQWAVLINAACFGCIGPENKGLFDLQHNPDLFREYLLDNHAWVLALNIAISAALGILMAADAGRIVFNWISGVFLRAPRIVATIATLSFALMLGGAAGVVTLRNTKIFGFHVFAWFPYGPQPGTGVEGKPAIPEGRFEMPFRTAMEFSMSGGAKFHVYEILTVLVSLAALGALTYRFASGRRGLHSRATASNFERAATLGVDVIRETKDPWRFAGALSGLSGVLLIALSGAAPAVGLDMRALTIVLAAVVLARLTSPGFALLASVLLGVLEQAMFWSFNSQVQFQASLVVIIGAALFLQRSQLSRAERDAESVFTSAVEPRKVPAAIRRAAGVAGLLRSASVITLLFALTFPLFTTPRQLSLGIVIVGYMIVGLSLLVLSGWAGQVSLGQLALSAVGAYVATIAAGSWHLPLPIALLFGAIASAVIAPLVGLPALRLPGPFVAIMTLAFALAVPAVLLSERLLGGALPDTLERPVVLGLDFGSDRYFFWFALLVLFGALAITTGLSRARLRRALIASRDNAKAASAFGLDVARVRLEAFAVAGFLAGLGGGLLAYANGGVQPDSFSSLNSVVLFLIVVIGGLSAVSGPVLGASLYGLAQFVGSAWVTVVNGFGTVLVLALRPSGLAGMVTGLRDAAIRVIMHLQGHDLLRFRGPEARIPVLDRGAQAPVVPVKYRLVGDGYGPVEGTRLRPVEGVSADPDANRTRVVSSDDTTRNQLENEAAPRLSCHRLDVAYAGAVAVSGVSIDVAAGEIVAVVGLNGAGKTSLLRALAGLEPAAHGTIELNGHDITKWFPHFRAKVGVAFVPGGDAVLPTLSVRDNLVVAGATDERIDELVAMFPVLGERLHTAAGNLSGGEQHVLALSQGIVVQPGVLLVDELSLGLSPEALATVLDAIVTMARTGTAVVLVEQSITTTLEIAHTAVFLESGRVRYQGSARELRDHPELFASVAFGAGGGIGGGSELARAQRFRQAEREAVLRVDNVSAAYGTVKVVDGVSFDVVSGQVVGVLGPNGAGKTSLFDCLSGDLALTDGAVSLLGEDITALAPHARAGRGLMRSFQSVRLFPSLTVRDCIAVALETRLKVRSSVFAGLWLPPARAEERRVDDRVAELLELLNLRGVADATVGSLSLGTRRMVDLACQLAARPKVLLLDEPAAGLAAAETEVLGPLVSRISSDLDCAVLIIEHNVSVLASVAHHLVAMRAGAVIAQGDPASVLADPEVRGAYFGAALAEVS